MPTTHLTYTWHEELYDDDEAVFRDVPLSVDLKVYLSRDLGFANEPASWSMDWDFASPPAQHGLSEAQIEKILRDDTHDAQIMEMALEEVE